LIKQVVLSESFQHKSNSPELADANY